MAIISPNISCSPTPTALNPNAPIFVPSSYRAVEDFSDKWWALVESSPWFRDYWLSERYYDPTIFADIDDLLDDDRNDVVKGEEEMNGKKDLISLGMLKWRKPRLVRETVNYGRKAPKFVNVKVSPRPIQQPR